MVGFLITLGVIAFLVAIATWLSFKGFAQEQERWVNQRFGGFHRVVGPGWVFIIPFFENVKAVVDIWEQPIDLFTEQPWIDFKLGGRTQLVQPRVWLRIIGAEENHDSVVEENVKKAIYEVRDWRTAVRETVELSFRSVLNNLEPEQVLEKIFETGTGWWNVLTEQFGDLEDRIAGWGFAVKKITVSDFNLSDEVAAIRREVLERERAVKIADFKVDVARREAVQKALESGGMHGEIRKILTSPEYGYSAEDAEGVATQLVTYFKGADTHRLIDWRGEGGDVASIIARIVVATQAARETMEQRGGGQKEGEQEEDEE